MDLDGLILAVPHAQLLEAGAERIVERLKPGGVLVDVKSVIPVTSIPPGIDHWLPPELRLASFSLPPK